MLENIEARFRRNLDRVDSLVSFYEARRAEETTTGKGRTTVSNADLLRSAVVFLHATLEDVVRSVLTDRWPRATDDELFERVPFVLGNKKPEKITLGQLAAEYGGKSVEDVLRTNVEAYLEHSNFNAVSELVVALQRAGLDTRIVAPHASELHAMMLRRHQIVHRADQNVQSGSGHHAARSLGAHTVRRWRDHVEAVCVGIVAELE